MDEKKEIPVHAIQLDIAKILEKNPETKFVKVYIESISPINIKAIELLDNSEILSNA